MVWRLETDRLILRPPEERDVPTVVALIGDYDVAKNLSTVPHPYTVQHAREWLGKQPANLAAGTDYGFSIARKEDGAHIGGCGLHRKENGNEFGYWLGKPYWKNGYATEAARRIVEFAFFELGLPAVWAGWFHDNPASGHVLAKIGCRPNGQDTRSCMARGHDVICNLVALDRAGYVERRRAA
jgi:RimJ/RimL family protein N-acetyltransferase